MSLYFISVGIVDIVSGFCASFSIRVDGGRFKLITCFYCGCIAVEVVLWSRKVTTELLKVAIVTQRRRLSFSLLWRSDGVHRCRLRFSSSTGFKIIDFFFTNAISSFVLF